MASQLRTSQQAESPCSNLSRLEKHLPVLMIEPVPYEKVRGVGFYRQFLNTGEWGRFMRAGRTDTRRVLADVFGPQPTQRVGETDRRRPDRDHGIER